MRTFIAALSALALVAGASHGGRVKTWHHARPGDHEKSVFKNAIVSNEGVLSLSRGLKTLAKLDATHVWALAEDGAGDLFAATGDEGKVYKIGKEGKVAVVATSDGGQALSLATDGKAVFAGTGPSGEIVKIDGDAVRVLCKLPASYVWGLAFDPKSGGLVAATGPEGKIFRVSPEGKPSLLYDTKQDHVLCVVVGGDGTVYAGTDRTGRVYRIDVRGKASVVHQAAQSEVRSLLLEGDVLHVGTSATKRRGAGARGSSGATAQLTRPERADIVRVSKVAEKVAVTSKTEEKKDAEKGKSASAPSSPSAGDNSIYRITADGGVREVFRDKVMVMALARDGKKILAGTGMNGQLFEVGGTEKTELARLEHGQLLCMLRRRNGNLAIGTGDPGAVYVLGDAHAASGTVTSEVLDAKLVSKWGALRWQAEKSENSRVTVAVRTGNVAEPDDTWSDWTAEEADGETATVKAPASRFLQYRVTLTTMQKSSAPQVKSITVRYAATNQAPEITKVEVPDLAAGTIDTTKKVKLKWAATDANEDELRYRLLVKKDGWDAWAEIEANLEKTDLEWDASSMPSGTYRVKVIASDHTDNPEGEALASERVSESFVVCHTAPTVTVKAVGMKDGRMQMSASGASSLVRLVSATYSVNGRKSEPVFPEDGLFDSKAETFSFRTKALKPGAYVVVLKVSDAAGNVGTADAVFTVPPPR